MVTFVRKLLFWYLIGLGLQISLVYYCIKYSLIACFEGVFREFHGLLVVDTTDAIEVLILAFK